MTTARIEVERLTTARRIAVERTQAILDEFAAALAEMDGLGQRLYQITKRPEFSIPSDPDDDLHPLSRGARVRDALRQALPEAYRQIVPAAAFKTRKESALVKREEAIHNRVLADARRSD